MEQCRVKNVELIILAGWMSVLTGAFINNYINKIINIHPLMENIQAQMQLNGHIMIFRKERLRIQV